MLKIGCYEIRGLNVTLVLFMKKERRKLKKQNLIELMNQQYYRSKKFKIN